MNRQSALISAMLLSTAAAQSATTSTVIGEVTLPRPAAVQSPTEEVQTLTTVEPVTPPSSETAQAAAQPEETAAPEEEVAAPTVTATEEVTEELPEQVAQPVQPVQSAAPATVTPATPVTPDSTNPPTVVPNSVPAPAQAAPAPVQAQPAPAQPTTTSAAQRTDVPSNLPAGWRHLSGEIFGSKSVTLPAGSKVQVAIEAVNRATGQHSTHLVVGFGAEMLGTTYNINYNPARLNTAQYDYLVQAKVFDAQGDMIYMSDTKQPLPSDLAAKLKIDLNF